MVDGSAGEEFEDENDDEDDSHPSPTGASIGFQAGTLVDALNG